MAKGLQSRYFILITIVLIIKKLFVTIILLKEWLSSPLENNYHKSTSIMGIHINSTWNELLRNKNNFVGSVIVSEGFLEDWKSIRFTTLMGAKLFVFYLRRWYGKLVVNWMVNNGNQNANMLLSVHLRFILK